MLDEIKDLIPLAPLHNPAAVSGIERRELNSSTSRCDLRYRFFNCALLARRDALRFRDLAQKYRSGAMGSTHIINSYRARPRSWLAVILAN